jgi:hypothetical protein
LALVSKLSTAAHRLLIGRPFRSDRLSHTLLPKRIALPVVASDALSSEYVVGHWWEQVLHNQSALRLKGRLLLMPGVMVTSVPWQLNSSERVNTFQPHADPGDAWRGIFD